MLVARHLGPATLLLITLGVTAPFVRAAQVTECTAEQSCVVPAGMDPEAAKAATAGCAEIKVCVPFATLTQPFRERVRNLQNGETATFQTILRDTRRYLLSNVRQLLQNRGGVDKTKLLDCFMRIYKDCQGSFEGLPTDGRRWLNVAKIRVLELMTLSAANDNPDNGLGVEGVVAYAKEGIEEAKNLIRNASDEAPPEPPPPPRLDSDWEKCLAYTFMCAGQCAANGTPPVESTATPACDPDLIATESLGKDIDNVLALSGTHVSSVTMGTRYVQTLRETALVNLIRAYGQNFGNYRVFSKATGQQTADCSGNPPYWDFVKAEASHAIREEDRLAYEVTSAPGYRLQAARAAADVVRNLFRREYFKQHQRRYQNGGTQFPGAISMTDHFIADPDCGCMREKLRISSNDVGRNADDVFQSESMLKAIDSCTPTCCGASGPDDSVKLLPGGTNGSCAAWKTFPVKQREAAEAEVNRSLRTFPILASGASHLDEIYEWTNPERTFPKVSRLFHALYTPRTGSAASLDPAFPDRGAKTAADPAEVPEAYESALEAAAKDFAGAVSRFCKSASDGGLNWNELVTLPDLAADVVAKQPIFGPVQECGKKAAEGNSALRTGATAVAGISCLALGVASAGIGVPACGVMFTGLALADYQDASRRSFLLGKCASAGADAGVCSATDAVEAENERITAGYMAAAAAAFTVVDAAVVGPKLLAQARDAYRRIQQSRALLSKDTLARLTRELEEVAAQGAPAAAARLGAVADEAEAAAATKSTVSSASSGSRRVSPPPGSVADDAGTEFVSASPQPDPTVITPGGKNVMVNGQKVPLAHAPRAPPGPVAETSFPVCSRDPVPSLPPGQRPSIPEPDYVYTSGSGPDSTLPASPEFAFTPPAQLSATPNGFGSLSIAENATAAQRIDYVVEPGSRIQRVSRGGSADVFKVTPPGGGEPQAVKVRFQLDDGIERTGEWMKRDLSVQGAIDGLAPGATYEGQPFIRTAKNLSNADELQVGIMRQEWVEGRSAFELKNASDVVNGRRVLPNMSQARAERILQEAGLSANQADSRLAALENFYYATHHDIVNFEDMNGLSQLWNRRNTGIALDVRPVGLDYNHGVNVKWVPTEQKFVIFDW